MIKRRSAFTLVEMLIVMGIMILFIGMAIPTIRVMTGARSISVTQNEISAILARARESAINLQQVTGVMFYLDTASDRVIATVVTQAAIQENIPGFSNYVMLDLAANNDSVTLPVGIRIQTIFNGMNGALLAPFPPPAGTTLSQVQIAAIQKQSALSSAGKDDRYMGFNTVSTPGLRGSAVPVTFFLSYGGVILFDGSGRAILRPYGFQMNAPGGAPTAEVPSAMCHLFGWDVNYNSGLAGVSIGVSKLGSAEFIPGAPLHGGNPANVPIAVPVSSQLGLVVFDSDAFRSLGFSDADYDINSTNGSSSGVASYTSGPSAGIGQSEQAEELWLDANSTPVLINRFDGTLIKSE